MRTRVLNHFHTFHPDAQAEHDRLAKVERDLTRKLAAKGDEDDQPKRRMSEAGEVVGLAMIEEVRAQIEEQKKVIASGVVRVVIKGLTRGEFRRLLTAHSPREGEALDAQLGYNSDTFGDALISACIVSTTDLDGQPVDNDWATWADEMTNGQWEEFFTACLKLTNDGEPAFPR